MGLQCGKRTDKASAAARLCFEALRLPSSDERGSRLHTDQGGSTIIGRLSYRRHRFPPEIIQHAIWLYLRFTLSYRDVEELLAERGVDVSYETVRRWVLKFGPMIARRLSRRRPQPSKRWHLDEMVVRIAGKRMYLWRAVDDEGEVLDMLVQPRRGGCQLFCVSRSRETLYVVEGITDHGTSDQGRAH